MDKETFIAGANATEKVAELGTKSLETGEKFGGFLAKLTGITDDGFLGLISDKIQFFRWERQCRMANKYNEIYSNQPMQPIPPKFLIPILENASVEEDDSLQDLWINLLGSWTNANYKEDRRLAFVDIVKALTPTDAMILKKIYEYDKNNRRTETIPNEELFDKFPAIKKEQISTDLLDDEYFLCIDNLISLRCIKIAYTYGGSQKIITITYLGIKFVEACMRDNSI